MRSVDRLGGNLCVYACRCIRLVEVLVKQGQEVRALTSRRGKVAS